MHPWYNYVHLECKHAKHDDSLGCTLVSYELMLIEGNQQPVVFYPQNGNSIIWLTKLSSLPQ